MDQVSLTGEVLTGMRGARGGQAAGGGMSQDAGLLKVPDDSPAASPALPGCSAMAFSSTPGRPAAARFVDSTPLLAIVNPTSLLP